MLKFMKNNKKEMFTIGLFGLVGVILVPVVRYIIKTANQYPKVFGWISFIIVSLLCIIGVLFTRSGNTRFAIICIGVTLIINSLSTYRRK